MSALLILVGCGTKQIDIPSFDERVSESQINESNETEVVIEGAKKEDETSKQPLETQSATLTVAPGMENFETYLPTLMFHYIEDVPADSPDQMRYNLSFSPEQFEEFLIYFQENNIETLTFWDIKAILEGEKPMPEKAVMLTFDDGHQDHYNEAFRLLEQYNMKGVFFIITDKTGNDPVHLTWDQVREMAAAGHEIGSHTVTHRELNTLGVEDIQAELKNSKQKIEEEIGQAVISLCYPVGRYDERVIEASSEHYLFARTTESGKQFRINDPYRLPTTRIFPTTGTGALDSWLK